jgi:hypothetical protein
VIGMVCKSWRERCPPHVPDDGRHAPEGASGKTAPALLAVRSARLALEDVSGTYVKFTSLVRTSSPNACYYTNSRA